jgi:RNA polymerase sigma factor (sigma-70 family)
MSTSQRGTTIRQIHTLFNVGAVGVLTDSELLEAFNLQSGQAAEMAFAVLMKRHGPMVLSVCQQVLKDQHDADDAFQATFVVLVRKARHLNLTGSLGPWLHGVALRVARCARSTKFRRQTHERRAGEQRLAHAAEGCRDDLDTVLHEEINRLPEHYRTPIVLCCLEGLTTEAAGRRLRCPQGTVLSRLSRARERLRKRLAQRGVTPTVGVLGNSFFNEETSVFVPDALIESTINTTCQILEQSGTGLMSTRVTSLATEVLITMLLTKMKIIAIAALMIGTFMAGVAVLARQETAPNRTYHVEPKALATPLTNEPASIQASSDRAAEELASLARQIRETVALLDRAIDPRDLKSALHRPDQVTQVESDLRQAQEHLTRWLGPSFNRDTTASATSGRASNLLTPSELSDPFASSPQGARAKGPESQKQADAYQPTLRAGGYIFTASPTGNKAIAYDPVSRATKSVQLNATNEHPIRVTPLSGAHVQHVALLLHGKKITRIAVFDLKSDRWLPMDLFEPVKGEIKPT